MWNPDYNTLRLGVLLPFNTKETERQSLIVRKTMSVRSEACLLFVHFSFVLLVEFVAGEENSLQFIHL